MVHEKKLFYLVYMLNGGWGSFVFTEEAKTREFTISILLTLVSFVTNLYFFSDSLSVLKALNHTSSRNSQIQKLYGKHHEITKTRKYTLLLDTRAC